MKWVKAIEKMPEIYPVNNTSDLHFKLDGRKVDGYFLHPAVFEYFDTEYGGYKHIEKEDFGRVEYLDESPSQSVEQQINPGYDVWTKEALGILNKSLTGIKVLETILRKVKLKIGAIRASELIENIESFLNNPSKPTFHNTSVEQEAEEYKRVTGEWLRPEWSTAHVPHLKNSYFFALEAVLVHVFNYDMDSPNSYTSKSKAMMMKLVFNSLMIQGQAIVDMFLTTWKDIFKVNAVSHHGLSLIAGHNSKAVGEEGTRLQQYRDLVQFAIAELVKYDNISAKSTLSFIRSVIVHDEFYNHDKLPIPPK